MKKYLLSTLILFSSALVADNNNNQLDIDKLSKAFGHNLAKTLQEPGVPFHLSKVIQGMQDELDGKPSPLDEETFQEQMIILQGQTFLEASKKNLEEADNFLAKNSKESGVQEIIPGKLQYKIEKEGKGAVVKEHSSPLINYKGTFVDGAQFGTSLEDEPITLSLDQTIPGFGKGLVGAKEGETRILYVHPDLAYGTTGQLPPNKALIFEVEIIKADLDEGASKP